MPKTIQYVGAMTADDLAYVVKDIIQYKLGLEENQLHHKANFQDDLGVDSLDLIELRMEIEKKFGIAITDEDSEKLQTVGSLIDHIKEKK
jgi:acyl carrier protein